MTTDQRPGVTTQPVDVHLEALPNGDIHASIRDERRRLHWDGTNSRLVEVLGWADEYINDCCLGWPDMNLIGLEGLA